MTSSGDISVLYQEFTEALTEVLAESSVGPPRRGRLARARARQKASEVLRARVFHCSREKKVSQRGIEDTSNEMGAYMVVRADSHEAAAKLFERHPHFTIFPGESVEIMPVLPIPGV